MSILVYRMVPPLVIHQSVAAMRSQEIQIYMSQVWFVYKLFVMKGSLSPALAHSFVLLHIAMSRDFALES